MNKGKGQGKIDKDNEGDTRTVKYTKKQLMGDNDNKKGDKDREGENCTVTERK